MSVNAKITRILNPTDFSIAAEEASRLAARLAMRTQASLVLFHAIPPEERAAGGMREADLERVRERLRLWFDTVVPEETRRFLPVEFRVVTGAPAQGIIVAVRESGADLIVMGTHGRSGVAHLLMGSVTESVLRSAPAPILALKTGQGDRPLTAVQRILWATDLSPASERVWGYTLKLADVLGAEVFLLHVVPPTQITGIGDMLVPPPWNWLGRHLKPIEQQLERRQKEVEALGLRARRKVALGAPAEVILAEAQAENADLIVLGTHGYTGLTHILLGSVAETVIRKAPCPVLAVRIDGQGEVKAPPRGQA
jgi:nucleotide-binding universal stress UspA family protein